MTALRLTWVYFDAQGGPDHANYHSFTQLCERIFLCLRRHAAVIYTSLKDANITRAAAEVQHHFDMRCGYSAAHAWGRSSSSLSPQNSSLSSGAGGSQGQFSGGGPAAGSGGSGGGGRLSQVPYGVSVRILDDEHARQMLRRALKSAEAAGNYYKINDMVHTLAKERGISGLVLKMMDFVLNMRGFVLKMMNMVHLRLNLRRHRGARRLGEVAGAVLTCLSAVRSLSLGSV